MEPFRKRSNRLKASLDHGVEAFRKGQDQLGLTCFLNSLDDLENFLVYVHYQELTGMDRELPQLQTAVQQLLHAVKRKDVIEITDLLEFEICPLVEGWSRGCEQ